MRVRYITKIPEIIPTVTICEPLPFSIQFSRADGNSSSNEMNNIIPATNAMNFNKSYREKKSAMI